MGHSRQTYVNLGAIAAGVIWSIGGALASPSQTQHCVVTATQAVCDNTTAVMVAIGGAA